MVSCAKLNSIFALALLAAASCQAKCPDGDAAAPIISSSMMAELEAGDKVNTMSKVDRPAKESQKSSEGAAAAPKTCECAEGDQAAEETVATAPAATSGEETLNTEQVVIKKVAKKYKIITITLPLETDIPELDAKASASESSKKSTTEPSPSDQISEDPSEQTEAPGGVLVDGESVLESVAKEQVPEEETVVKTKSQKKNKKYKRDVGTKSGSKKSSSDKKSSKRGKNKEQGKRKSKK